MVKYLGPAPSAAEDIVTKSQVESWIAALNIEDTGWTNATLVNSWSSVSGLTVQYRRVNGVVYLQGRGTGGTTNTAFTLPSGFRPSQDMVSAVQNGATVGSVTRTVLTASTGTIQAISGSQPNFNISFPAA